MAEKKKGFTGRTAAWLGLAGAAVVGLYFWAQKGKGETLHAHYSFSHQGPADSTFKARVRIGDWNPTLQWWVNTLDNLVSIKPLTPLEQDDLPRLVEGDLELSIPTGLPPGGPYDIEFYILDNGGQEYSDGIGKTRDIQESKIELLGTGKFNLI